MGATFHDEDQDDVVKAIAERIQAGEIDGASNLLLDLVDAGPTGVPFLELQDRRLLTQHLLTALNDPNTQHQKQFKILALKTLKELSRLQGGSNIQSEPSGLRALLTQVSIPNAPTTEQLVNLRRGSAPSSSSASDRSDNVPSSSKALSNAFSRAWTRSKHRSKSLDRRSQRTSSSESTTSVSYDLSDKPSPSRRIGRPKTSSSPQMMGTATFTSKLNSTSGLQPTAEDWEVTDTALRCLNNALYLHETSRRTFAADTVGGARKAVALLRNPWQTPCEILFLAGRLLFYATLFEASFNRIAVEEEGIVEHLRDCLNALTSTIMPSVSDKHTAGKSQPTSLSNATPAQIKAAQGELLKVIFNLGLYYPRQADENTAPSRQDGDRAILGEQWHEELAQLLDPVIQLLFSLPATSLVPPVTNAIGVLLNFPVAPYSRLWHQQQARRPSSHYSKREMANFSRSPSPSSAASSPSTARRVANALFAHGNHSGKSPRSQTSTASGTETLASADSQEEVGSSDTLASRLVTLLSCTLARYFPPTPQAPSELDPDDRSVHVLARNDGVADLEDTIQPLFLLLRKMCVEDESLRCELKRSLLPEDLDRSIPRDKRGDTTGRLVRLMASLSFPRLARASGELLLALCKSDPTEMVANIGYGPCAGWLVSNGFGAPVPSEVQWDHDEGRTGSGGFPSSSTPSSGVTSGSSAATAAQTAATNRAINPITGAYESNESDDPSLAPMTEEEKEEEASRLFDLFDRLNQTGVMKVPHPVRDADQSRFQEIDDIEAEQKQREEQEEEERALREFAAYKARTQGARS